MRSPDPVDYMNPLVPDTLPTHRIPLVRADAKTLEGYGTIVTDPAAHPVEIVTWPQMGTRPIDQGTGNEGGYAEGTFRFHWQGDMLYAENHAVNDQYLFGWSCQPGTASTTNPSPARDRLLIWHANYHPDGGQLFFPAGGEPFVTALALPGDDIKPDDFIAFYFDGSFGVCIHPDIWHEAIVPLAEEADFIGRQGKVHARVSCNFPAEFGCFLEVPLNPIEAK